MSKNKFSHLSPSGDPKMVDVGHKEVIKRSARAQSLVHLPQEVIEQLENEEIHTKKGPVFQTAIIAGIMAAKKTHELIPLCHPLALDNCNIQITINNNKEVVIECTASISAKTGVEMEALTGASIAALTIYDMCKGFSQNIRIVETRLVEKIKG